MDFQLTDEQRMIKETVYKWAVNELGPLQEKIDEEDWFPPDFFKKCAEIGILGITIDEKYGGLGGDVLMQCLAIEEMSRDSHAARGTARSPQAARRHRARPPPASRAVPTWPPRTRAGRRAPML